MKMNLHGVCGCWVVFMASQVLSQAQTSDGGADTSTDDKGPYVDITFYKTTLQDWVEKELDIKHTIASKATMYCMYKTEECGMKPVPEKEMNNSTTAKSHRFLMHDVKSGEAEQERIYVKVPVAIKLPVNATNATKGADRYLNENSLTAILKESAKDLKERTNLRLRRVGEDDIDFPPNHTLNAAIIPVAVAILLVLIVIAIVIRIRGTKSDHKEAADQVALEKKKPVKLVEMRKLDPEPAASSSADGNQTMNKEGEDAGNVTESAALLDDKDGNAVRA